MQTVYVPVSVEDALPHHQQEVHVTGYNRMDKCFIKRYKIGISEWGIGFFDDCGNLVTGYSKDHDDLKKIFWLKPTEAVLLSKEDADRVVNYQSDKDNEPFGELEKYLVYIKSQARVEICWCPDEKNGKWLAAESYSDTDHYIDNEDVILWASIPMPSPPKPNQ